MISRRTMLQTLAIGAGAAFNRNARGATAGGFPGRFLFIYVPNGIAQGGSTYEQEFGKPIGVGTDSTQFTLGTITAPLEPFREQAVLLDNLELKNAGGDTHIMGMQHVATGKAGGGNISPHEYLAQKIGLAATPALPILRTAIQTRGESICFGAGGIKMSQNQDPYDVFRRTFTGVASGSPMACAELAARLDRRQSVLDFVSKDLAAFRAQLPAEDRLRADAQLDGIRTLEARAKALRDNCGKSVCTARPPVAGLDHQDDAVADQLVKMQLGNIVNAFACDLTRVASLQFRSREFHYYGTRFAPVGSTSTWHGLSHDDLPGFRKARTAFDQWVVDAVVAPLSRIPEGAGTMLDNTLVLVTTEIGRGHSNAGLQWFTVGGKNMGVRVGRFLKLGTARTRGGGQSITNLYVSILNAMGVPDRTFGADSTGPLPGFLAS